MKGYSAFTKKTDPPKKTYPKHYTKDDIKFLKEQNEDVVRKEDKTLYPKGKSRWLQNLKYRATKNVKHLKK